MDLWEEAAQVSLFGLPAYAFGLYVAGGALAAFLVMCWSAHRWKMKPGAAPLTMLLCLLCGGMGSRLFFCLMNQELGFIMPLSSWFAITGGGWSMMGVLAGALLGGFLSAKALGEKPGRTLDLVCLSLPLFIALERLGEQMIPDFDVSRALESDGLAHSFLAVRDDYDAYLKTWMVAAICAVVLFIGLLVWSRKPRRDGDLCVAFLLLFGAGAILMESLRYDRFLSITFVGLQEIIALLILCAGVIAAVKRAGKDQTVLRRAALIALPIAGLIGLGLEFALDRTRWNKELIYLFMALAVFTPAVLSLRLMKGTKEA